MQCVMCRRGETEPGTTTMTFERDTTDGGLYKRTRWGVPDLRQSLFESRNNRALAPHRGGSSTRRSSGRRTLLCGIHFSRIRWNIPLAQNGF